MRNLRAVAEESRNGITPLYYSIAENAVYTADGEGRHFVTDLIRENTEAEIKQAVRRWLAM